MGSRKGGVAMKQPQLLRFAQLALQVARQHLPPYGSKYSPKKFTQPSLWACLLVKEYLRMDYRGLEDLWASSTELRAAWGWVLDVPRVHAALGDPQLWKAARATTLRLFWRRSRLGETGFCRRPARHDSVRRPARGFRMGSMVVGVRPQAIWAQGVRVDPGSPSRLLPPWGRETVRHGCHARPPPAPPFKDGKSDHRPESVGRRNVS